MLQTSYSMEFRLFSIFSYSFLKLKLPIVSNKVKIEITCEEFRNKNKKKRCLKSLN
jgi:hypothetical protein